MRKYTFLSLLLLIVIGARSQDSTSAASYVNFSKAIHKKSDELERKVNKSSEKLLKTFRRQERRILRKLRGADSATIADYRRKSQQAFSLLEKSLKTKIDPQYNPYLDTIQTALKYLTNIDNQLTSSVQPALESISNLNTSFSQANLIEGYLRDRQAALSNLLNSSGAASGFKKLQKTIYYYNQQINEYKEIFKDKKKLEKKGIELLMKTKPFREFMRKNSMLASMFRIPSETADGNIQFTQDLQSRAQINSAIQGRFNSQNLPIESIRANIIEAKDNIKGLQSGIEIPQKNNLGFRPNSQRSKPLLKRLEFGGDIQFSKSTQYFPQIADIAGSVGFKLNDYAIIGAGLSSKVGFGQNWDDIHFTYEGLSVRSFANYKAAFGIYLYAGYELNYKHSISNFTSLTGISSWQKGGLAGLSKKYKLNRKHSGTFQILWDYLSYKNTPASQPIIIRTGFTF